MSTDLSAALADEAEVTMSEARLARRAWIDAALTVLFASTAVLLVSFIAVAMNL